MAELACVRKFFSERTMRIASNNHPVTYILFMVLR